MKKGQATVEFLFAFVSSLILVSLLSAAVLCHRSVLEEKAEEIERIIVVESAARAVESAMSSGISMEFDFRDENVSYSVEDSYFLVAHGDEMIETRGVFIEENAKPV
ncbi:hypothetical protein GF318_01440 [Candidatus Micrarchaeota archaeon]|nr:hypothetical protein [Candidatus Micrarchaeota archaeon]